MTPDQLNMTKAKKTGQPLGLASTAELGVSTEDAETQPGPPPQFHFPQQLGLGITRSTGNMIALLLHTERPHSRASILAWAAKDMGITLDELVREYQDA